MGYDQHGYALIQTEPGERLALIALLREQRPSWITDALDGAYQIIVTFPTDDDHLERGIGSLPGVARVICCYPFTLAQTSSARGVPEV